MKRINLLSSKYYLDLEDKNVLHKTKDPKRSIPFYTPFVEHRKDIDRSSALYSIKTPFELMHVIWLIFNLFPKRQQVAKNERIRLQTDLEFQQNEIKTLNEKYNMEIFSSRVLWRKADGAEQKIRELKRLLFKSKEAHKAISTSTRFNPERLIRKATGNMNIIQSLKYGHPLEVIKENASEKFR